MSFNPAVSLDYVSEIGLIADTGQDIPGGLCLEISVSRAGMFGHEPALRPAPDTQHELAFARCLLETQWRDGDVDAESPIFSHQVLVRHV